MKFGSEEKVYIPIQSNGHEFKNVYPREADAYHLWPLRK